MDRLINISCFLQIPGLRKVRPREKTFHGMNQKSVGCTVETQTAGPYGLGPPPIDSQLSIWIECMIYVKFGQFFQV